MQLINLMCEKVRSVLNVTACGIYDNYCDSVVILPVVFEENNSPT
jgi:hypothetical protein